MAEPLINRVYDIKISSFQDTLDKVQLLTEAFEKMDVTKRKLNLQLQETIKTGDTTVVASLVQQIKELENEMAKLKGQRESAVKESNAIEKSEKSTAAALLLTAKATTEAARAEKIRIETTIIQNREQQRQLDIEEKQRQKLEAEKGAVFALEAAYERLRQRRIALEAITGQPTVGGSITFENQILTLEQSLSKLQQLKIQESEYVDKLTQEKLIHDEINRSATEDVSGQVATQRILQLRAQKEEEDRLLAIEKERLATEQKMTDLGTFDIPQGSGQAGNRGLVSNPIPPDTFTPSTDLEKTILQIVRIKEALAGAQAEQKRLQEQLKAGTISQGQFDEQIVRATQFEIEFKRQLADTNAELKNMVSIDSTVEGSIRNLEARNKQLRQQRDAIPVTNATAGEAEELKTINSEINHNNDLIRINNDLLSQQKINVGNYASSFKSALNVLETELISINTQLKTTGIGSTQIDELTRKQTVLTSAIALATRETTSASEAQRNYRLAAQQVGQTFGEDSQIFRTFTTQVAASTISLNELQSSMIKNIEGAGSFANAFKDLGLSDVLKAQQNEINAQINKLKQEAILLAAEYKKTGITGKEAFALIDQQLKINLEQQEQLRKNLQSLDGALQNTGNIGGQISNSISNGFKNAKQQVGQLLATYVGFQAAFSAIQQGVGITKELSDSTTNLEIELGKAAGGAANIVDQLAKLDTRTKLTGLEDIANIAARAGVSEDKLVGVTQAIDKIKIAFGKDFGDVEAGTESLVKLVNVFEGTDKVTGENLLRVGNSVRTLANESVASVPFLTDFAKRMAGLKGISDITLPSVLGLASGFEQFGQTAEVSSTAIVRIIPKLAADTAKFADVAGLTQQAFSDLLKNDPAEALIKVAEGFTKGTGSLEEFETAFKDSGLGSGRVTSIIGVLGENADKFRQTIESAGVSFQNTSNIEDAFAAKNENLASTIDKLTKKFADAANSTGFRLAITAIVTVITAIIGHIPALLVLLGIMTIAWGVQATAVGLTNFQLLGYRLALIAMNAAQSAATAINAIFTAGLVILNAAYALVTRAANIFNLTIGRSPIGLIITGIALLATALLAAQKAFGGASSELANFNSKAKITSDVNAEAARATSDARAQAQLYIRVIRDTTISHETQLATLKKLIAIDPVFKGTLKDGVIQYNLLDAALSKYNNSLRLSAELEASRLRNAAENKKLTELNLIKQEIENAKSTNDLTKLSEEAKKLVAQAAIDSRKGLSGGDFSAEGLLKATEGAIKAVDNQIDAQLQVIDNTQKVFNDKQKAIDDNTKLLSDQRLQSLRSQAADYDIAIATFPSSGTQKDLDALKNFRDNLHREIKKLDVSQTKIVPFEIDIPKLKADIEDLQNQIDAFQGKAEELAILRANLKKKEDELKEATREQKPETVRPTRGSRLTGLESDEFKNIQANANIEIEAQKLLFRRLLIDEETYLREVLKINQKAADDKTAILNRTPVAKQNAQEKLQITELSVFKIEQEEETNKKLFDIRKKDIDSRRDEINRLLELQLTEVTDDPIKSNQEKLQARERFVAQSTFLQITYNKTLEDLQRTFNQRDVQLNKQGLDDILKLKKEFKKVDFELQISDLDEIQRQTNEAVAKTKLKYDALIKIVLDSSRTLKEKNEDITKINLVADVEIGAVKLTGANKLKDAAQTLFNAGLISADQFEKIFNGAIDAQKGLDAAIDKTKVRYTSLKDLAEKGLGKLFGFKEGSEAAKAWGEIVAESFDLAKLAMESYFENEKQRIEHSKEINQQRLDIELQQAKSIAGSKAEEDSLDRQFAAKKEALNRDAFEKEKKLRKQQLTINYAIQLANIAVAASANPLNPFTFGAAGIAQYIIQAAIATAAYLINLGNINKAQYATGGKIKKEDIQELKNGRINTPSNIATQPNGDNILATVKIGEVILNEEQQKKLGGDRVFKAIGVPGFAKGGFIGLGDGIPGSGLLAPINPSSFLNSKSDNTEDINKLFAAINRQTENVNTLARQTNQRIDKLMVVLDPRGVKAANDKITKATAIGTL